MKVGHCVLDIKAQSATYLNGETEVERMVATKVDKESNLVKTANGVRLQSSSTSSRTPCMSPA